MDVNAGSTNVTAPHYFVDDTGGANPGEPTAGLLFSDIETGGSASYQRQGAARVDLTLKTLANAASVHDDGGFILIDDTEMAGTYRCDWPDAAFAAGVDFVILYLRAASAGNTITRPLLINLTTVSNTLGTPIDTDIATDIASVQTDTTALLSRIVPTLFTGISSLAEWLGMIAGKQVGNTTARNEIRATGAGSGEYDETADSLEANSGSSVTVYPLSSQSVDRVSGTTLKAFTAETPTFTVVPTDADGNSVDTSAMTLEVVIEPRDKIDIETIVNANIAKTTTSYSFATTTSNATAGQKKWSCRRTDTDEIIGHGDYIVTYAAEGD